jgi:hypothetical protein
MPPDQGRSPSTAGGGGAPRRGTARPLRKNDRHKTHSSTPCEIVIYLVLLSLLTTRRAPAGRAGARTAERLMELLGLLDLTRHVTYLEGVQFALAGCDDAQITHAVTRIARPGQATINPIGLLVDRARPAIRLLPAAGEYAPHVVEPLEGLWSTEPTGDDPVEDSTEALPALDPDPTLAPALAARTALEAARQPVTRGQLAARQASLDGPQGGGDGTGGGQQAA